VQQFESLSQGLPSCSHPPDPRVQRPGFVGPRIDWSHWPEQHSSFAKQTSNSAWQEYAGAQVPDPGAPVLPLQFAEQQSAPVVQASPSVLQPFPPGSAAHASFVQTPVQHSAPVVHDAAFFLHVVPPHVLPAHVSEQHSPGVAHVAPSPLQKMAEAHVPLLQIAEQQSPPWRHVASAAAQLVVGDAHWCAVGSHRPEQQSSCAAQEAVSGPHWPSGSVQIPFAQELVQQSAFVLQENPSALQSVVATHVFAAQPWATGVWQQSPGTVHPAPGSPQGGTWQVPVAAPGGTAHARPKQQSGSAAHAADVPPQVGGAAHRPPVQPSPRLQQGTSTEQVSPVPAQTSGAVHTPEAHSSAPLQQTAPPAQLWPVSAQVAGATQTDASHVSAGALQHGTPFAQLPPVAAHSPGSMQNCASLQVAPPSPQQESVAQLSPLAAHAGPVGASFFGLEHAASARAAARA
jgi:hypothetical protein